jgi:4-alpha-glucanotransferase
MKVSFKVNYFTQWGQNLCVCGSSEELGKNNTTEAFPLQHTSGGNWEGEVKFAGKTRQIEYKYLIKNGSEDNILWEWGSPRLLDLAQIKSDEIVLEDAWRPQNDVENTLLSQAFAGNLFKRANTTKLKSVKDPNCRLQLVAPRIGQHQSFCVVGSCKSLGGWNPEKALMMQDANFPVWQADFNLEKEERDFEYKYAIYDHQAKKIIEWETGENRYFSRGESLNGHFYVKTDLKFRYPFGLWKGAGVAIPVFSIRTKNSFGVGEFADIKLLIDWAKKRK